MLKNQGGGGAGGIGAYLGATWRRGTGAIVVPVGDVDAYIPVATQIKEAVILTEGGSGSCVIDVWRRQYATYPPTVLDSICGSAKPTISGGIKYDDPTLTGWLKNCVAGDVLRFHLESCDVFTRVSIFLVFQ